MVPGLGRADEVPDAVSSSTKGQGLDFHNRERAPLAMLVASLADDTMRVPGLFSFSVLSLTFWIIFRHVVPQRWHRTADVAPHTTGVSPAGACDSDTIACHGSIPHCDLLENLHKSTVTIPDSLTLSVCTGTGSLDARRDTRRDSGITNTP
jgi:hypothetical protein